MIFKFFEKRIIVGILFLAVSLVSFNSCQQYEYVSPAPGTLRLKLHSSYTQFDTLFSLNNFTLKVTTVQAIRSDGIRANVFQDVKAVGPTADVYNVMGRPAFDSSLVIGEFPLPPADYIGMQLQIEPGPQVVLDGYRFINVDRLADSLYTATILVSRPFSIEEARVTDIVLTVDIDATLRKLAYTFLYQPVYYISSVTTQ